MIMNGRSKTVVGQYRGLCLFASSRRKGGRFCGLARIKNEAMNCGNRGSGSGRFWGVLQTDVKNGGFLRFVGAGHVVVAQGRDDKQYRHESGHLGQQTARTGAAEYGGVAAAENDAHYFLARLEQDKDNEGYTYDDMQGKNQGLHGGNSSAGWTMPALNRLCQ